MPASSRPLGEGTRLDALRRLGILDRPADELSDRITQLTARSLDCPMALLTFIDSKRQWIKSAYGIELPKYIPRDAAFCAHVIVQNDVLVIEDTRLDPRFSANPLVTGKPHVRFYAGCPLRVDDLAVGSLCVLDIKPRQWHDRERRILTDLCEIVRDTVLMPLRSNEAQLRQTFENAPIGLAVIALDGRYLHVNRAMRHIVGYQSDELLNLKIQELTHPDDVESDLVQVRRVRAREIKTFSRENRYIHKLGHIVWVAMTATIVRDRKGKALHYIAQLQDITERRAAESARTDFIATAAHELRSPLSSIYGFSELLLQKEFQPEKQRELLAILHDQARHMTRLINEMLDLARMESRAGRDFNMARHTPQAVVEPAVRSFQTPGRNPAQLHLATTLPEVLVDADKTRQALTNILSNAFKYSTANTPVIVDVEQPQGKPEVHVRIRDQGIGIARAELRNVFDRFFRVNNSGITGTGLGMTLVKEIAERQGGWVSIDSEVGKGTEVTLMLPAAE